LLWPGRPDLAFFPASGEPSNRARLNFPKDVTYVSSFWIVAVWVVDDVIRIIQGSTDRDGRAGGRRTVMCLRLILIAVALWLYRRYYKIDILAAEKAKVFAALGR